MTTDAEGAASEPASAALSALFERPSHNPSFEAIRSASRFGGRLLDFCVPVNAHFPPPRLKQLIVEHLDEILKFYPDEAAVHEERLARLAGVAPECVVAANGSTELITALCRTSPGPLVTSVPTFGRWTDLPAEHGIAVDFVQREESRGFALDAEEVVARVRRGGARSLVLCNPNNPTGAAFGAAEIAWLLHALRDLPRLVIDESFIDFSAIESCAALAAQTDHAVVVKSMGKSLGWHGIRLGYAVAGRATAAGLRRQLPYWNVNGLAAFVLKRLPDFHADYVESFGKVMRDRNHLHDLLRCLPGLTAYPSLANFIYVKLHGGVSGKRLRDLLLERHGIVIRECSNKLGATEHHLRLAVNGRQANARLVEALAETLRQLARGCGRALAGG